MEEKLNKVDDLSRSVDRIAHGVENLKMKFFVRKVNESIEAFSSDYSCKSDEDLKMIGVSSIDSLFSKVKNDEKGTGEESTLGRRCPNISEGENLVEKIDESGFGEVKTLASDAPTILDYKDFNYDSYSLIDCMSLLHSMINSHHAYEQNKAFTKHIVDDMMKAFEEKLELEVSIPRKLYDE